MLMIIMTMMNIMRMRTIHSITNGSQIKAKLVMMMLIELVTSQNKGQSFLVH